MTDYAAHRRTELVAANIVPYPHKFEVTLSVPQFIQTYGNTVTTGETLPNLVRLAGRILRKASSSKNLFFYDLYGEETKLQILSDRAGYIGTPVVNFDRIHSILRRGDIIGVVGYPHRSRRNELSIRPIELVLLSPCLHMLPAIAFPFTD